MRLRPTELGFKGCLLLVALGVAFLAAAYSNLFFLIIAFCCVLGSFGLWWTVRNTRRVAIRVIDAPQAAAGSTRQLLLAVTDTTRRTPFDLTFTIELDGEWHELAHLAMLRGEARVATALPPLGRGVRRVENMRCTSRFPFGLFQVTRLLPVELELVTFPRPLLGRGTHHATHGGAEDAATSPGVAIAGLRPFRSGDSTRDVHWKATARRGEPIVKERERGGDKSVEIVVDRRCDDARDDFEAVLSAATATLLRAVEDERAVRFRSQDHAVTIESGQPPDALLQWLAGATPLSPDAAPPARAREVAHA